MWSVQSLWGYIEDQETGFVACEATKKGLMEECLMETA